MLTDHKNCRTPQWQRRVLGFVVKTSPGPVGKSKTANAGPLRVSYDSSMAILTLSTPSPPPLLPPMQSTC